MNQHQPPRQDAAAFAGSVPEHYDRHLGPVLFAPFAADLVGRWQPKPGCRVLEVAAGTGIVTRALLGRLPADGRLCATDLSQAMLDHAKSRLPPDPRLELRTADAQQLPFADGSFDAVVIQFGVMFFADKTKALAECRRVLAPGGQLLCNTWCSLDDNQCARLAHETVAGFFPADPPRFLLTPYGWNDLLVVRATFAAAGFPATHAEVVEVKVTAESAHSLATGFVRGTPLSAAIQDRLGGSHDRVVAALARRLTVSGTGTPWRGTLRAIVVKATA